VARRGPARLGKGYIDGGRENRHKENSVTEDPIGKHVQESSRRTTVTKSQNRQELSTLTQHT